LMFKIVLTTLDPNISPVINFNTFDLFMATFKPTGEYIQLPFTLN
jgi:phenylacetate-coenzyme A ligase PaaK-like adenylate-forming protein